MKRIGIGDITRSGGINGYLREVHSTGEPLVIMRTNEPVVILLPANDAIVSIMENSYTLGNVFKEFANNKMEQQLELYLFNQILLGIQAETLLLSVVGIDKARELKENIMRSMVKSMHDTMKVSSEEVGNAGEQPAAPMKGSKTKKGTVKRSPIRTKKK